MSPRFSCVFSFGPAVVFADPGGDQIQEVPGCREIAPGWGPGSCPLVLSLGGDTDWLTPQDALPGGPALLPLHFTRAGKQLLSLSPLDRTLNSPTCSRPPTRASLCPMDNATPSTYTFVHFRWPRGQQTAYSFLQLLDCGASCPVWPWAGDSTSLYLSFLTCKGIPIS